MLGEIDTLDMANGSRAIQKSLDRTGDNHLFEGAIGGGLVLHSLLHSTLCPPCAPVILTGVLIGSAVAYARQHPDKIKEAIEKVEAFVKK